MDLGQRVTNCTKQPQSAATPMSITQLSHVAKPAFQAVTQLAERALF
jgi:hypothetical protein